MNTFRIWVDDIRPAPEFYVWVKSVDEAISFINKILVTNHLTMLQERLSIEVLDLDHDAGDYRDFGGDYIKILDWLEEKGIDDIPLHFHSQNPVGVDNMRRIANRNGWSIV